MIASDAWRSLHIVSGFALAIPCFSDA